MVLYRAFAVALLATLSAAPCLDACAVWLASDHAHMACCLSKSAEAAEICCASTEGRQHAEPFPGMATASLPRPAAADVLNDLLSTQPRFAPQWERRGHVPSPSHRHVRIAVFLI